MPAEQPDLESDVRSLVARVLDGVLEGPDAGTADASVVESGADISAPDGKSIAIASDHGGYELKRGLAAKLADAGYAVQDLGTDSAEACDYPDFAHAVARQVAKGNCAWGIMIDGAGIGSAMVANKVPGVRAAACYDISTARNSREHNRANVLTLGAGLTGAGLAWQIVEEWLATPWGGDRHLRRVALINEIEEMYARSEA